MYKRQVQQARKDAGLDVSDRITLRLGGSAETRAAVETHRDLIARETLATSLEVDGLETEDPVTVAVRRA